jgi:class 3 adenylate cyclase
MVNGNTLPFLDMGDITLKGFDQAVRVYKIELQEA